MQIKKMIVNIVGKYFHFGIFLCQQKIEELKAES